MNKTKVIVANPGLGAHVRHTVRAYFDANLLSCFYTTFVVGNNKISDAAVNKYKGLKSKQFKEIPNSKTKKLILPEFLRLISSKFFSVSTTDSIWEWSELLFDKWVAKQIDKNVSVFHGYEHASLACLEKCKSIGVFSVYEQPSAHHLYLKENVLLPLLRKEEYFNSNFKDLYNSELSVKRNHRRDEELTLASLILCNSSYVKRTLIHAGVSENKILTFPLGFPEVRKVIIAEKASLRFIISGNLSYLKGTHHVLRVWKNNPEIFANHELICIGTDTLSPEEWESLPKNVIKKDRMNSDDYLLKLSEADVYILNTYSDGFGMVMSEAMANGLAVIGTENSAAVDIIEDGVSGKVLPVGDEDKLLDAMKWMISNPSKLVSMRQEALAYAANHSWDNFRIELPKLILEKLNSTSRNG